MEEKDFNELNDNDTWLPYYEATETRPPRPLLVEAVEYVETKETALDLGAGALRDTKHLLNVGFSKVIAIDSSFDVARRVAELGDSRLDVVTTPFDTYDFPENTFDLVNAQFSLPFNSPETFEEVFNRIELSLKSGGIFCGQLFGANICLLMVLYIFIWIGHHTFNYYARYGYK